MCLLLTSCMEQKVSKMETRSKVKDYGGWRLAVQCWTFNRYTFYEAIDKASAMGLRWIEAYPNQALSKDHPGIKFGHEMPVEYRAKVKEKLRSAGVTLVNYGVVGLSKNESFDRKIFDFAKDMGIETIVSEPPAEAFDVIDRLCNEYRIHVAVHNHPKPTRYWNPENVLRVLQGRSSWIGACADTGHWVRSGLDPVQMLKKYKGRIVSLHFKEIDDGHDVVWGTGAARVKPLLEELDRQNFKGVFSIEYEHNWENSMPEIRKCIEYFEEVAGELR